jgi:hypothetical protein
MIPICRKENHLSSQKRSLHADLSGSEMEPAPQFKLNLRPYQKQALKYASAFN